MDRVLMYFATLYRQTGDLSRLKMVPLKTRRLQLQRLSQPEAEWIRDVLTREGEAFGTRAILDNEGRLHLQW